MVVGEALVAFKVMMRSKVIEVEGIALKDLVVISAAVDAVVASHKEVIGDLVKKVLEMSPTESF